MKRFSVGILMATVLALSTYAAASAQAPRGGAGAGPRGEGPGARGAMAMLRGLELTDQQRAEVRTILQEQRDAREALRAEARLQRELRTELFAEAPDSQKLADLQQQLAQAHAERLAARIGVGQQLARVLTAEQRATVRERLAQAPARGAGAGAWTPRGRQRAN